MMRIGTLTLLLLLSLNTFSQSFSSYDSLKGTLNPFRSCYDVTSYDLSLSVNIPVKAIAGSNKIFFTAKEDLRKLQIDLYNNLRIDSIVSGSNKLCFTRDSNAVFVSFPSLVKKGSQTYMMVYYHGKPREAKKAPWDGGFVWARDSLGNAWVAVACEGKGASLWWPCKDHPSDEPDSVTITVRCPREYQCISNGTPDPSAASSSNDSAALYRWKIHYPVNTYNVTLNIGRYSNFSDTLYREDGSSLPLDYYVLSYNLNKARKHFGQVKKILTCYEHFFGKYPFPLDGYALVETPYWGMEHQSAIAYGNRFKNDVVAFDFIILHETAHEWWGNNVTAADMGALWIHESFATYAESLLIEYYYGRESAIRYLLHQRGNIENKQPLVLPEGVGYFNPDDTDIYYKGAWMLHTLRSVMGDDARFFQMLLDIQKRFRFQTVSSKELVDFIARYTGRKLTSFFSQYLTHTSIPVLEYDLAEEKGKMEIACRWQSTVKNFEMPVIIQEGGRTVRVNAGTNFKTYRLPSGKGWKIADDLELIQVRKVNYFDKP